MNFDRTDYINQPVAIEQELKLLFNQNDSLVIFEIGACEGEESIKYARLFRNSKIYSFEPLPDNINLIHDNFLQYGIKNASYYNKALSSKNGTAEFFVSSGRPENAIESDWDYGNKSSSLLPPEKHLKMAEFIRFDKKIEVETITLKSFCSEHHINIIDFIHMDVQGAELMVLEGAEDFIKSIKVIWLEVSKVDFYKNQPLLRDVKKFMKENNFVLIKDALHGAQGDQLYISMNFYKKPRAVLLFILISVKDLIRKYRVKLGFSQ
ncbi:MAG: FkbM family methyltransferase [Ferruginibacter sp.]|nr:FkbM family methyltransferase [Ferruginibacter sp.]